MLPLFVVIYMCRREVINWCAGVSHWQWYGITPSSLQSGLWQFVLSTAHYGTAHPRKVRLI